MKKSQFGLDAMMAVRLTVVMAFAATMSGCASLAVTAFAIGASTGVQHTINGVGYRTFTQPPSKVRTAALAALADMRIRVDATGSTASDGLIKASTPGRKIELQVEQISPNTTRLRAVVNQYAFLRDAATANEIILQTERIIAGL